MDSSVRVLTDEEAWQITCHEAGHAVVAIRLDVNIYEAIRGDGEHGEVSVANGPFSQPDYPWSKEEIRAWRLFYCGGAAGEEVLFGSYREYACSKDKLLHSTLQERWPESRTSIWAEDVAAARDLLDQESVRKVAEELDLHRKLSIDDIYAILSTCPPWDR